MCKRLALFLVALGLGLGFGAQVGAVETNTVRTDRVLARLIPELEVVAPGESVTLMLNQQIIEGWHTYWRNPGDSGEKIALQWTLPSAVTVGELRYPLPERIEVGPLVNYGYSDEVALLSDLHVPSGWPAGTPVHVEANATWLVCEETCIPESARFAIEIQTGLESRAATSVAALFERARTLLPRALPWPATVVETATHLRLRIDAREIRGATTADAYFFASSWGLVDHPAAQTLLVTQQGLELMLKKGELPIGETLDGVVVLSEELEGQGVRAGFTVSAAVTASAGKANESSAAAPAIPDVHPLVVIALAFAGGLLLNFMPCVFPVLAMKSIALVHDAQRSYRARVVGASAYALGVLASFLVLGATLLALKAGGAAVGWGFQLQSPLFVTMLIYVLFAVGLNLSGAFTLNGSWASVGQTLTMRAGAAGSFFTGVLAAVVATPCTAPFMAGAIGAALALSPTLALATLISVGAGLAFPFVALTLTPGLARRLPKPGLWMERLKQVLAFPMYASACWLVWVLAQQTGPDAVFLALLGGVSLSFGVWLLGVAPARGSLGGHGVRVLGVAALVATLATLVPIATTNIDGVRSAQREQTQSWEPFSTARLAALRATGRPAFVNMTAAWCITCKVNERVALSSARFVDALKQRDIVYLKGDWTRRDPEITAELERFGRAGVPLYVYFPPRKGEPVVLPQVLTEGKVLEVLKSS